MLDLGTVENMFGVPNSIPVEKFQKIKLDHVKDRPFIDFRMAPLRVQRWKEWKRIANIELTDYRNSAPQNLCHYPYSDEEKRIFKQFQIKYCPGNCFDKCKYLELSNLN